MLVVFAHPDDEVLALGARLERLTEARIVTVTDGVPTDGRDAHSHGFATLDAYRNARRAELQAALAHAGLPAAVTQPFAAMPRVADQEAALRLVPLTKGLCAVLGEFAPEIVLTHPYEGGHPDHDACAFAVHTALALHQRALSGNMEAAQPIPLLEAPFYHSDGYGRLRTGAFLHEELHPSLSLPLSAEEQRNKRARLACFGSQADTLRQFGTGEERFRLAPRYDFTRPPHTGELLYEYFHWGMNGERFRLLATEALQQLFPHGTPANAGAQPARTERSAGWPS